MRKFGMFLDFFNEGIADTLVTYQDGTDEQYIELSAETREEAVEKAIALIKSVLLEHLNEVEEPS